MTANTLLIEKTSLNLPSKVRSLLLINAFTLFASIINHPPFPNRIVSFNNFNQISKSVFSN